jgi:hypothetical protein
VGKKGKKEKRKKGKKEKRKKGKKEKKCLLFPFFEFVYF